MIAGLAVALLLFPQALAAATAPGVGSSAPPLELTDLGGTARKVTWGEDTPAATIVYFFDPQSSDCLLEMSLLDALYLRARDFGLAIYAVEAGGRQPAEVSRSMERYCMVYRDPSFPVLPDPAYRAGRTYGAERVPATFIMESHGVILNRIEGYDHGVAVAIVRRLEQLLRRERGFLSPELREAGVSEAEEQEAEARLAAAVAARAGAPAPRALGAGDRAPDVEFTDLAGLTGRWSWSGDPAQGPRVVLFFGGLSLDSVAALNWLDALARRGRESGLDVLAVEAGGMGAAELQAAIQKYRRYNPDPSFPVVPDPGGKLARAFGPWEKLPQTYVLAGDGTVAYHAEGFSGRRVRDHGGQGGAGLSPCGAALSHGAFRRRRRLRRLPSRRRPRASASGRIWRIATGRRSSRATRHSWPGSSTAPCRSTGRRSKSSRRICTPWCARPRSASAAASPAPPSSIGSGCSPCGRTTPRPRAGSGSCGKPAEPGPLPSAVD